MIIEARHLAKRFGRFEAIEDLNLSVPEGAVFALIGSNGTGKTTTIRMLMNILRPDRGDITVLGTPSRRLDAPHFQRIGYVSESQQLPDGTHARAVLQLSAQPLPDLGSAVSSAGLCRQFELRRRARSSTSRMACA